MFWALCYAPKDDIVIDTQRNSASLTNSDVKQQKLAYTTGHENR